MGIMSLLYVPSKLFVWDNAAVTFTNISANETLFRLGFLSSLVTGIAFLLLPFALCQLFNHVHKTYALLMVVLAVVSVPVSLANIGDRFTILDLIAQATCLEGLELGKLQAQVMFYLQAYSYDNPIVSIFWGLWLLPFGYLIFKSDFCQKSWVFS